jgi:perosamine synthetase
MDPQQITEAISAAARTVVESGRFRSYSGPNCERLSSLLAESQLGAEVLLTSSGTAAMELALRAAGVREGDQVLLSAYDYPGNFWAIERLGARPVLLDTEPWGWRVESEPLLDMSSPGKSFRAMIVSHLHGQLQAMSIWRSWCETHGIMLIEDACQAIGASVDGQSAGSWGHASIISFGGSKVLSAGRGGALFTADRGLAQRARILSGGGSGPFGLSELQAAVLVAQLPWLAELNAHCRQFFASVAAELKGGHAVRIPFADQLKQTVFYQAGLLLAHGFDLSAGEASEGEGELSAVREAILGRLRAAGIVAGAGFAGFHRRSARRCQSVSRLQHVAKVAESTLTIHHSAAWSASVTASQIASIVNGSDG